MASKTLEAAMQGLEITEKQAVDLLSIPNYSTDYYRLLSVANHLTRTEYDHRGYVFAQMGINGEPCSKNCRFCSMGKEHYRLEGSWKSSQEEILSAVESLLEDGPDDLFLMATGDYNLEEYLSVVSRVKQVLPQKMRLVANIGDFDRVYAEELKDAGVSGVYHIVRLREGEDTDIDPQKRVATLDAIRMAKLELYYCVEPIGPEHTYRELVTEMLRAREYKAEVMAVMRRVPVPGTPLFAGGIISSGELAKIAAVTRIVSKPGRAMGVHEPNQMALLAGVNQIYAESGTNPRDLVEDTVTGRGLTVAKAREMLAEADYKKATK